jgi:hypothetical protein
MNLIKAPHLETWSRSLTARANLPGLVASLIRSSCPSLQSYRFPTGDASETHGFDGVAEVVTETTFVPSGRSIWEFGTGENYKKKASDGFKKRTDELSADDRAKQTFTFVTSRIWDGGPEEWEKERASSGWLKVRALDATSLELWLSEYPAVSLALARKIRDLIEELAADQIEVGIMISRFNQRGSFRKELWDGGNQERCLAQQYRDWAAAVGNWPRTRALLERIAEDWDRQAKRADTEAKLDQVRGS